MLRVKERQLTVKCCAITLGYVTCFILELVKSVHEVIFSSPVSESFDFVATSFATLNPLVNAILLFTFDAHVRFSLLQFLNLEKWYKKTYRSNSSRKLLLLHPIEDNNMGKEVLIAHIHVGGVGGNDDKTSIIKSQDTERIH